MASDQFTNPSTVVSLIVLAVTLPFLGFIGSDHSTTAALYVLANLVLLPVVGFLVALVQEATVLAVARLLGDRGVAVIIGVGPGLVAWSSQTFGIQVRAIPLVSNSVIVTVRPARQRLRCTVAMISGLAMLVALVLVVSLVQPLSWAAIRGHLATGIALDSLVLSSTAIAFYWSASICIKLMGKSPIHSARLVLGFVQQASIHLRNAAYDQAEAVARRGLEHSADEPMLLSAVACSLSNRRDPQAFELIESLTKRELPPHMKPQVQNQWAWECYMRGTDDLRAIADDASRDALAALPNSAPILDTRGHVLLWNRRYQEAEPLLSRAYERATTTSGKACAASGLAMLCSATSRPDAAAEWLTRARAADAAHPLVLRAAAAVEPLRR